MISREKRSRGKTEGICPLAPAFRGRLAAFTLKCQGRSKRKPPGRSKRGPVIRIRMQLFSGEKGLWSVAEEAFLP
jgi:hypothetical protein